MQKILAAALLFIFLFTGCQSSQLGIVEVDEISEEVEELIKFEHQLQLIHIEEQSYLVFHSSDNVSVELETQDETVIIQIDTIESERNEKKTHVYELTLEPQYEVLEVQINGESTPIDNVTL